MADPNLMEWSDRHPDKAQLRTEIWSRLKQVGVVIRDPFGHIPNFVGAEQAAAQLAALAVWQAAKIIKCNPDSPQTVVRLRALQEGKRLYMAVPRLTSRRCFVELTAATLQQRQIPLEKAATMKTALQVGKLVSFEEMEPIDLLVVGCVAVTRGGDSLRDGKAERTGKGAGFADLELAMLREFGLVQETTPIVTTVHPLQILENGRLPMESHDWAIDWIATVAEVIETCSVHPRPLGLDWEAIRPDQYRDIPILRQLKPTGRSAFNSGERWQKLNCDDQ